ncbi:hypothetical protein RJT34_10071 [Clitoria ternatea]|uniref:Epidermal patterning factor-like protein n=1 Tax=Clitoria ternatea TaxID=43366 RepID=A0AAN9K7M5_CLITE
MGGTVHHPLQPPPPQSTSTTLIALPPPHPHATHPPVTHHRPPKPIPHPSPPPSTIPSQPHHVTPPPWPTFPETPQTRNSPPPFNPTPNPHQKRNPNRTHPTKIETESQRKQRQRAKEEEETKSPTENQQKKIGEDEGSKVAPFLGNIRRQGWRVENVYKTKINEVGNVVFGFSLASILTLLHACDVSSLTSVEELSPFDTTCRFLRLNKRGRAILNHEYEVNKKELKEREGIMVAKHQIGSRPPKCENRCRACGHCEAVQVPVVPQIQSQRSHYFSIARAVTVVTYSSRSDDLSNYKPMSWKCKCGDYFFNP